MNKIFIAISIEHRGAYYHHHRIGIMCENGGKEHIAAKERERRPNIILSNINMIIIPFGTICLVAEFKKARTFAIYLQRDDSNKWIFMCQQLMGNYF